MSCRIATVTLGLLAAATGAQACAETFSRIFSLAGRPSVRVLADDASVRVLPSQAAEVAIRVEYSGYKLGRDLRLDAHQNADQIEVTAREAMRVGISLGFPAKHVRIVVLMPKEGDLHVETGDGAVAIESLHGEVSVRSGDGAVSANQVTGNVFLKTGDGAISVSSLSGEVTLQSGDGSISGADLDGRLQVSTGDGAVKVKGRFDAMNLKTGDGSINARASAGSKMLSSWSFYSGDGSVQLRIPNDLQADLDASTGDGRISCDIDLRDGTVAKRHVQGKLNGGGSPLEIRTSDGSISIETS